MAFAPYGNFNRKLNDPVVLGQFSHTETKVRFEYGSRVSINSEEPSYLEYPNVVFLIDGNTRFAKIKKTVAYVVIDEDENGWVIEKWPLRQHKKYT